MSAEEKIHEGELVDETALARPSVPTTINQLASLEKDRGVAIIEQRLQIFQTMRVASIALTMPNDWTLFKDLDGRETGFLGDQGCDRIKKLWGIQVNNLGPMTKIEDADHPGEFAFSITGDGSCGLTGEAVFEMQGVRYSTERYATEKPEGLQRIIAVQKAARANLDGGITRELAGMKSVPIEELDRAWADSWKKSSMCNKGRGYGSSAERKGSTADHGLAPAEYPICDACLALNPPKTSTMAYKKEGKDGPFWYCPNWKTHEKVKSFVKHEDLLKRVEAARAEASKAPGDGQ